MTNACRICGNTEANQLHVAREMAFGLRDKFSYLECGACGCVQLLDIPADLHKFYPPDYYSFQKHGKLKTFLRHQWSAYAYGRPNPVGWLVSNLFFPNWAMRAVRRSAVLKTASILDVGCGSGRLLLDLAYLGFKNLTGVDPFIPRDIAYDCGVRVFKKELRDLPGSFELVMLHFSYEHMDNSVDVMQQIQRLMRPGGQAIVRIPVASSYAWKRYGVNWVNLDPPRHLFIHTSKSMELTAKRAGLEISGVVHEGSDEQFWASEQFEQDIPSNDPRSLYSSPMKRLLAWKRIRACKLKAEELNKQSQADLVSFSLRKPA